jgi:prepilin-type N-terminal cleavage/methylation domain-containing protein
MRTPRRPRPPGFTLVEAMVVVTILGVAALIGPRVLVKFQEAYMMLVARNDAQRDARGAVAIMTKNISQAKARTVVIDTPPADQAFSRITFKDVYGRDFQFLKSGDKVLMVSEGITTTLAANVVYLSFAYPRTDDIDLLNVSLGITKAIYRGNQKYFSLTVEQVKIFNKAVLGTVGGEAPFFTCPDF